MDFKGQVAVEYMILFFISIIIITTISMPLAIDEVDQIGDIKKTMEVKMFLSNIADNVDVIYNNNDNIKVISIKSPGNITVSYRNTTNRHYIYSYVTLSNGSRKRVDVEVPCHVSFMNNPSYTYTRLYSNRNYYSSEIKCIDDENSSGCNVNIYFK
ncbi:MAG: hypothetical protein SOZ23_07115 [Methanosphaera sp.]|uniref:hypothetical protein n=1 Tax=Methanosphaera sp. TaxID=2666342 RepID=UPI0025F8699C|nr:hypothetical protein [Methanosphaera sp.]MCI5867084.1 hypothetical protein [Methanosphaera sp.]MDD6535210.1 hypothetical protein [Methanosphaera sp.]MDY3956530.1 hypothetical protein [Methanosphaera sp.]